MPKNKDHEPLFNVAVTIRASMLGPLLAHLDNKAENLDVKLIREVGPGKNFPRGAIVIAINELLAKGPMPMKELKAALHASNFAKQSVHGAVVRLLKNKQITEVIKGRNRIISKGKGNKE